MIIPKPLVFALSCAIVTLFFYGCARFAGAMVARRVEVRSGLGREPTLGNGYGGILGLGVMALLVASIAGLAMMQQSGNHNSNLPQVPQVKTAVEFVPPLELPVASNPGPPKPAAAGAKARLAPVSEPAKRCATVAAIFGTCRD